MLFQKNLQGLCVPILTYHVTRSVPVTVFCIVIGTLLKQGLQDGCITANTGDVKGCSQVLRLAVDVCSELSEDLNHLNMALVARNMQRRPSVRVALVEKSLGEFGLLLGQQFVASLVIALFCIDPNVPEKSSLLLLVLLTL